MVRDLFRNLFRRSRGAAGMRGPLEGDRRETVQRLQVGAFGLVAMILLVGLASMIQTSAEESRAGAVPEAAPPVIVSETPTPARDPLADAGVVPDLPPEPGTEGDGAANTGAGSASGGAAPVPGQD